MSDFVLKKIELCGFRGFTRAQEVELGYPLTLVSGGNRRGKSSLLNAVEWCLFGSSVAKEYGGIRERIGWEVTNLKSSECYVQCQFDSQTLGKKLVMRRTQRAGKKATDFWFELEGEARNTNEAALHAMLRISSPDFVRAVHLHPEALRNLIVALPSERKDAIDRLLGLSELPEIAKSVEDQKPRSWTDSLASAMSDLSTRLEISLKTKKASVDTDVSELKKAGLGDADLSLAGAMRFADNLAKDAKNFASQFKLAEPGLVSPADLKGLENLFQTLPSTLEKLRNQHPALRNQAGLVTTKSTLEGLKKSFEDQLHAIREAERKIDELPQDQRDPEGLDGGIDRVSSEVSKIAAQMQEVEEKGKILTEALSYFRARSREEFLACPVCGQINKTASDWQAHIEAEITKRDLKPLQDESDRLEATLNSLKKAKETLTDLQERVASEKKKLETMKASIEKELTVTLKEGDDPVALLRMRIETVEHDLQGLTMEVESVNRKLSEFDASVRTLDRLIRVARAAGEIEQIEGISENEFFKDLKAIRQQCEQYVEDVELLVDGLQHVRNAEATKRLSGAQTAIAETFKRLTNRPDFPGLQVSPRNYTVELTNPTSTQEALPVLNQGDLNCAALSIFLALATAPDKTHHLGFIILDDPSQSLDTVSIRNLCQVLQAVCDDHQVIIATVSDDLRDQVLKIPKSRTHVIFDGWDPKAGPNIRVEST